MAKIIMNKLMMINNTRILQLQVIQIPLDKLWERYNKLSELTERLGKNSWTLFRTEPGTEIQVLDTRWVSGKGQSTLSLYFIRIRLLGGDLWQKNLIHWPWENMSLMSQQIMFYWKRIPQNNAVRKGLWSAS